jgi:hypothetical protein
MQSAQEVLGRAEQAGRILAAQDFSQKYGVEAKELISDESLKTPEAMEAKAARLAWEKATAELKAAKEAPERFDSGLGGTTGASVDAMSPEEKVRWGLEHPPRKRKT